jgi:hypothetical protein
MLTLRRIALVTVLMLLQREMMVYSVAPMLVDGRWYVVDPR